MSGTTTLTAGALIIPSTYILNVNGPLTTTLGSFAGDATGTSDLAIGGSGAVTNNLIFTSPARFRDFTYSRASAATFWSNLSVARNWTSNASLDLTTNSTTITFDGTSGTQTLNPGSSFFNITHSGTVLLQLANPLH